MSIELIKKYTEQIKSNSYNGTVIVSTSGGETSMDMTIYLKENYPNLKQVRIFDNTSRENDETLDFVHWCDKEYKLEIVWLEAVIRVKRVINGITYILCPILWTRMKRKYWESKLGKKYLKTSPETKFKEIPGAIVKDCGIKSKVVTYETACRDGRIFHQQIAKEGIPNTSNPSCTSRLKVRTTLHHVRKRLGLKHSDCLVAVGIRSDEFDRMKKTSEVATPIYPYISILPMTKPMINFKWSVRTRRLKLKGWEGNCQDCFKKSLRKLLTIAKNFPERFSFNLMIEKAYGYFITDSRLQLMISKGENPKYPVKFHRKHMGSDEILKLSKETFEEATDDAIVYDSSFLNNLELDKISNSDGDCSESCEAF